jgi:membrane protein YdbS with pleckstrin-like domain
MIEFENKQVIFEGLPDVRKVDYQKLDPAYKTYALLSVVISFGILFVIIGFSLLISGQLSSFSRAALFLLAFALLFGIRLFIKYYGYGKKGYAIRQHDVLYKSGIWWKRNVFIPKKRIQHVEIKKTPLEDAFEICRLLIFTAGGSGSDLVIPGLKPIVAERLKENLMTKINSDEEE